MIAHGSYDNNTLTQLPNFQENPNNDNPYGFLVDGVVICLGYTRTFQLFMNLLDIKCITVEGTAYNYTADHAWNQVHLGGEWYCVDVTWDDPTISGTVPGSIPEPAPEPTPTPEPEPTQNLSLQRSRKNQNAHLERFSRTVMTEMPL